MQVGTAVGKKDIKIRDEAMKKQQRNEDASGSKGGEIFNKQLVDRGTKQFDGSKETCYPLHRDVGSLAAYFSRSRLL